MYPEIDPTAHLQQAARSGRGGVFDVNDTPSDDAVLAIRFFMDVRKNNEQSKKQGRLVCDDVEMLEIRIPGGADIIRKEVGEEEKARFPRQYEAFRAGQSQDKASGTPLAEWPLATRGQVEEAAYFGVRTVEALAKVADAGLQRMGAGWLDLRKKAVDWLKKAKDGALLNQLREELEERDRRIDALEKMLNTQGKEIESARAAGGTFAPPQAQLPPLTGIAELIEQRIAAAMASAKPAVPAKKRGWPKGKARKLKVVEPPAGPEEA